MAGIKFLSNDLGKWSLHLPSQKHEFQLLLDRFTPRLIGWEKEFHEAVSYLAGEYPMLAMRLRAAAMRANFSLPPEWPVGQNAPEAFATIASHFIEPTTLDEPIRQLAKLHGRQVLRSVNEEIESQDSSDPEISELIERLIPFAGKPNDMPTNNPQA